MLSFNKWLQGNYEIKEEDLEMWARKQYDGLYQNEDELNSLIENIYDEYGDYKETFKK